MIGNAQFGATEVGLLGLAAAVAGWMVLDRRPEPLPPVLPLSAETVVVLDPALPLTAAQRARLAQPPTDATWFGAYALGGGEVFNATGLGSLEVAEAWVMQQCRAKAADCRVVVRLVPAEGVPEGAAVLSPALQRQLERVQAMPAIAAFAANGYSAGGWSYGMRSRKAARAAAVAACEKAQAERGLPEGSPASPCVAVWAGP